MNQTTVFVAGSMSIKHLHSLVIERLSNMVAGSMTVVVGDADGVDTSIQNYLAQCGHTNTTVYCAGEARNNVGNWPTQVVESRSPKGTRAYFTAKDVAMAEVADFGFMVWDAKSTGTLSNVLELLSRKKKTVVFGNKAKRFVTIASIEQFETELLSLMSEGALAKAEEKLLLGERIRRLRSEQSEMF